MNKRGQSRKRAVIIGAGPAGLTAAYELLTRTDIVPTVVEKSNDIGGLSRTVNYKGNKIDVGGHRFFSKSERVVKWWLEMLPLQSARETATLLGYRGQVAKLPGSPASPAVQSRDQAMLIRERKSRIYFKGKLFDYPVSMTPGTIRKLGVLKTIRVGLSYLRSRVFPIAAETNLEEFIINRFGRELYGTFFKTYTEKVWGVPCKNISAEWGIQRIKGLSLHKLIRRGLGKVFERRREPDLLSREVETSLIEHFLYPKYGPGQMWEEVARRVKNLGGEVLMPWCAHEIEHVSSRRISAVHAVNQETGESQRLEADYVFSTMPVKELVSSMKPAAPREIREVANGLIYREFITVGLLCDRLTIREPSGCEIKDNWIYIQEPGVMAGRLQIFNNWSPAMVADPATTWIGVEYFCNDTDEIWQRSDSSMIELARGELAAMNILHSRQVLDATVIRAPKAYPAYFGSYDRFGEISSWSDRFENLFLIGRNGMHKYNNQDHSMLTAMVAVDNIIGNIKSRANLWALNTEQEYQEEQQSPISSVA